MGEKKLSHSRLVAVRGSVQRRGSPVRVVVGGVHVGPSFQEQAGSFELTSAADGVTVEVLNAGGHVIDTLQLGAQTAGRHGFEWNASKAGTDTNLTFRIAARSGAAELPAVSLMRDRVNAVNTGGDTLTLELARSGSTPYAQVKAFN